ncbi:MAG: Tyrosine recombinase XerD [bacterium ADurb.Bin429]|nr:MAG: Tyrosine recombinase XerD [bacterium ADurb.Bin429]
MLPACCAPDDVVPELGRLLEKANGYCRAGKADATRQAYQKDWHDFARWCLTVGLCALPADPTSIALYLTAQAETGHCVTTLTRRLTAIGHAHRLAGHASPTHDAPVPEVMAGIRRTLGTAAHGVDALVADDIRRMVAGQPDTLQGVRNRALLLLGFAGGFRRSELVGLDIEDLQHCAEGLCLTLRRSKTDQEGQGRQVAIPYGQHAETCPVRAYQDWVTRAGIGTGPVFRPITRHATVRASRLTGHAVAIIIKAAAEAVGLDPATVSGHSLRVGHVTTAARAGVPTHVIMQQTGHRSERVFRRYIRSAGLFAENSAAGLGL